MAYQVKVGIYVAALLIVVTGGMLGSWAYLELQHVDEQRSLVDCIRAETVADGQEPAMQVIESSITQCQD